MDKKQFILISQLVRQNCANWILYHAPDGFVVLIQEVTRSIEQNNKLWPMLTDVSKYCELDGKKYIKEDWKTIFTASLREYEMVNFEGNRVLLGKETSKMGKKEFSQLIELIYAYGANNGVVWSEKSIKTIEDNQ